MEAGIPGECIVDLHMEFSFMIRVKWTLKTKLLGVKRLIHEHICSTLNKEVFVSKSCFFWPAASCVMLSLNFKGTTGLAAQTASTTD